MSTITGKSALITGGGSGMLSISSSIIALGSASAKIADAATSSIEGTATACGFIGSGICAGAKEGTATGSESDKHLQDVIIQKIEFEKYK